MTKPAGYVSAEYLRKAAEIAKTLKQRSYELMHIQEGAHVLDVGCGPGIDTIPLAAQVGGSGRVSGVDIDSDMLNEAEQAAAGAGVTERVEHLYGDVLALPLEDDSVDACRAERLLQVLPKDISQNEVVAEMLRVLKPGGRMVLVDADWNSASVDYPDWQLERRLMHFFTEHMRPNGNAGRTLMRLLHEQGLVEVEVELFPMLMVDYAQTPFEDWLVKEAVDAGIASTDEMRNWQQELNRRNAAGSFYSTVNMVVAAATRKA